MESCIEYTYHWSVWHQFLTCCDTQKIWWVVERCQIYALFQSCLNSIVDQY